MSVVSSLKLQLIVASPLYSFSYCVATLLSSPVSYLTLHDWFKTQNKTELLVPLVMPHVSMPPKMRDGKVINLKMNFCGAKRTVQTLGAQRFCGSVHDQVHKYACLSWLPHISCVCWSVACTHLQKLTLQIWKLQCVGRCRLGQSRAKFDWMWGRRVGSGKVVQKVLKTRL